MREYLISLYEIIPNYVYEILLSILCLSTVIFIWKRKYYGIYISRVLTVEYLFLIFCSTVFFREVHPNRELKLVPFWSYDEPTLLYENIMNVVVFAVLGLLMGISFKFVSWFQAILIGLVTSIMIEMLQYIFKRGICDIDDIIHNTIGYGIGVAILKLLSLSISFSTRSLEN